MGASQYKETAIKMNVNDVSTKNSVAALCMYLFMEKKELSGI